MIRKYKKTILASILVFNMMILSSIICIYIPIINKQIIDIGIMNKDIKVVVKLLQVIFLLYLLNFVLKFISNGIISKAGTDMTKMLKERIISKVFRSQMSFFDQISSGELAERIREVDGISIFFTPICLNIISSILSCIGGIIVVYRINPYILLFYCPALPTIGIVAYKAAQKYRDSIMKTAQLRSYSSGVMYESIEGIAEIKTMNRIKSRAEEINSINEKIYKQTFWQNIHFTLSSESIILLNMLISIGITLLSATLIINNNISIGQYLAVTQYTSIILAPAQLISSAYTSYQPAIACLKRLKYFDASEEQDIEAGVDIGQIQSIGVESITFSYNEVPVLKDINFSVSKGEKLAIVGANGCGKTTIAKLLLGLYGKYTGDIKYNGKKSCEFSLKSIRREIAIVFQETFLFNGSLMDNITFAVPNIDKQQVVNVLEKCGILNTTSQQEIDEMLSLPILEGGKNLSGGQKRRIALARALIKKPSVLILDEATAYLDGDSREVLKEFICKDLEDLICIIITHDTDVEKLADKTLRL